MKTIQKLEVGFGLAALIFAIIEFVVFQSIEMTNEVTRQQIGLRSILSGVVYQILPALLMAVGSFYHVFRKSRIGLITVIFFGVIAILTKALTFFLINTIYDVGLTASLVVALSGVLAILTILFALISRKLNR